MCTEKQTFWELANMSEAKYIREDERYRYCYMVGGQKYRFIEDPYEFAIQKAREMYPAEIEEKFLDLFYRESLEKNGNFPRQEKCRKEAEKEISRLVIEDPRFGEWLLESLEWRPVLEVNVREEEMDRD